jgi:hypothetical protein
MLEIGRISYVDAPYRIRRCRKCQSLAETFVIELFNTKSRLNENKRKDTLHKMFEHDMVQSNLLKIAQKAKDAKRLCKVLESVKSAYAHIATNKSNENVVYQNALFYVVVSSKHKASQNFMSKTIGVNCIPPILDEVVVIFIKHITFYLYGSGVTCCFNNMW